MWQKPETVKRAVHTPLDARHLERIADLATNVAGDVVFMVEGEGIPPGGGDEILACLIQDTGYGRGVLLFRAQVPPGWLSRLRENLPALLVDHAHLERRAATSALALEKYRALYGRVEELNAIALEELRHFQLVMGLLRRRGIPFGPAHPSPWISGMMRSIRSGRREQVIDHLLCCSLIEGRSCEKFQCLAEGLRGEDPELAAFYADLVESEGNHYSSYLRMARSIDEKETKTRLEDYLDLDAVLMRTPNKYPVLH